jgi:predicted transcriptional regulator
MAILKSQPKKPNTVTIQARVEESVKFQLDKYAEFIHSSPSYVITEALKLLFRRDEEFKRWLSQHPSNGNAQMIEGALFTKTA